MFVRIRLIGRLALLMLSAAFPGCLHGQGRVALGAAIPGRYIVRYRTGAIPPGAEAEVSALGARLVRRQEWLGISVVQATAADAARLAADPAVESVVQDRMVAAHALQFRAADAGGADKGSDGLYHSPAGWAVRAVGGFGDATEPGPWTLTRGAGVRIAILDSGVDATHPALAPNLALNLSEVNQTTLASACDDGSPQDQQGHGTWAASLAAGAYGPGTGEVAGVAPAATLLNIKVLQRMPSATGDCNAGQAAGLLSWVIQGIEDAVAARADIVSMSLGTLVDMTTGDGAGLKAMFDHVTHAAFAAGTVVIAAAGNDGFSLADQRYVELPAQARDVVAIVASTNPDCAENLMAGAACKPGAVTLPYYSNYGGPLNALAAPGGSYPAPPESDPHAVSGWVTGACSMGVAGTVDGGPGEAGHSYGCFGLGHVAYVQAMGTSASAPLAAGAAALLLAAHPGWDAAAVVGALRSSARRERGVPVGVIDVAVALTPDGAGDHHTVVPGLSPVSGR